MMLEWIYDENQEEAFGYHRTHDQYSDWQSNVEHEVGDLEREIGGAVLYFWHLFFG